VTIAFGAAGTKVIAGTSTIALGYPASVGAGNLLLAGRALWTDVSALALDETGWTARGDLHGGTGAANDAHTSRVRADSKEAAGGETGTVTFDQSATGVGGVTGIMARYTKAAGMAWNIVHATADDNTHAANRSVTTAAMDLAAGDMLVAFAAIDTEVTLTITSPTFTASGITFGTVNRRTSGAGSGGGQDGNLEMFDVPVNSGSGNVAVTFAFTTTTAQCGPVTIVRLREVVSTPEIALTPGNISFSGVAGEVEQDFPAPVSAYNFDEGSGLVAADIIGTRDLVAAHTTNSWNASGHTDDAIHNTGASGGATGAVGANSALSAYTVMFWMRREGTWTNGSWSSPFGVVASPDWYVELQSGSYTIDFWGENNAQSSGIVANLDTWYHVAVVRSGTTTQMYIDGIARGSAVANAAHNFGLSHAVAGTPPGEVTWNGSVDDLRVFDVALTPPQIVKAKNTPVAVPTVELVPGNISFSGTTPAVTPGPIGILPYESTWNDTTDPKTVTIPRCEVGDTLYVIGGSGQTGSVDTTAMTTSTDGSSTGATTAWTEPIENLNSPATETWIHSAVAEVTTAGDIVVQVDPTRSVAVNWGFSVIRGTNSELGNTWFVDASTAKTVLAGVSSTRPTIFFTAIDFNAAAAGTAWTPADGITIERAAVGSNYTVHAGYWVNQPSSAGTNYGYTGGGATPSNKIIALEIKPVGGIPEVQLVPGQLAFSGVAPAVQRVVGLTPGVLSLSGVVASVQRIVALTPGSFVLAGAAPAPQQQLALTPGALTFAGVASVPQRVIALTPGQVVFAGQPFSVQPVIGLTPGSLVFGGLPMYLPSIALTPGVLSFQGISGVLQPVVALSPGSVAFGGVAPAVQRVVSLTPGVVAFQGVSGAVQRVVSLVPGNFSFFGTGAMGIRRVVALIPGVLSFSGVDPGTRLTIGLVPGNVAFLGVSPQLMIAGQVQLIPGNINFSGLAAAVQRQISVVPGVLQFSGQGAAVQPVIEVIPGALQFAGVPSAVQRRLTLTPGQLQFQGVPLGIPASIQLVPGVLQFTGQEVVLIVGEFEVVLINAWLQDEILKGSLQETLLSADLRELVEAGLSGDEIRAYLSDEILKGGLQ
jgi:hypothetical protein